jgi:ATP-binding cassette, subfamily G (WHITE), member 1
MFIGPVICCPWMLLSVYGIGSGFETISPLVRICMKMSYLRHSLEGIIDAIYGFDRGDMECPDDQMFCPYQKPVFLKRIMGFDYVDFRVSVLALFGFYLVFNFSAIYLIKNRLNYRKRRVLLPIQYVSRVVKQYFNFTPYKM